MSKRVFVDSDVILDILCARRPHYDFAARLFTLADGGSIHLATTSVVYANVFYILRKAVGLDMAKQHLRKLRILVGVVPVDEKIVDLALNSAFVDFEDGLQYYTAREHGIATLLTRNLKDYKDAELLVQTPEEFVKALR